MRRRSPGCRWKRSLCVSDASPDPFSLRVGKSRNVRYRVHEHLRAAVVQVKRKASQAVAAQRSCDVLLFARITVEKKKPSASRTCNLSAGGTRCQCDFVQLVQSVVAHSISELLLSLPGTVQNLADLLQPSLFEGFAHGKGVSLDSMKAARDQGVLVSGGALLRLEDRRR